MLDENIAIPVEPAIDPTDWRGPDQDRTTSWQYRFDSVDLAELEGALAQVRRQGLKLIEVTRNDFPLTRLARTLDEIRKEVQLGRGFALLRGLPAASKEDAAMMYWGIGMHVGYPVPQNARGQLLGHVTDLGERPSVDADGKPFTSAETRGYNSRSRFFFHVDNCDIVGLLCLHPAKVGGESLIVSAVAIHNELLRCRPDLLKVLYEPLYVDRQYEVPAGAKSWYKIPVFMRHAGRLICCYVRFPMQNSQRFSELPQWTPLQREAFDLVDKIADDPAFHLSMDLQAGDIQLLDNYTILHTRTAYEDFDEEDRKRHLLRLWLVTPDGRSLPPWFYERFRGGRRGGIYVPGMTEVASMEP